MPISLCQNLECSFPPWVCSGNHSSNKNNKSSRNMHVAYFGLALLLLLQLLIPGMWMGIQPRPALLFVVASMLD